MSSRRFPPPWSVQPGADSLIVTDASGRPLAFVYAESARGAMGVKPTLTEAETIAAAIGLLPGLMGAQELESGHVLLASGLPPPWVVLERPEAFVVLADNRTQVCWVYVGHPRAGDLTRDEARRIASGVARLPELV